MNATLSMVKVSKYEFAVMVLDNRVGTIARDYNNWIGYFNKNNPYKGTSENEVFIEMLREFNRYKLCGSNNAKKAAKVLSNLQKQASEVTAKLNKLGETEVYAAALEKVLI